jgi:carbonic anhydrase/acetyltransferase-like protein (isoleucine patch superfamily)
MAVYALGEAVPSVHRDAFVHPQAVVIGGVTLGAESSVWPGAVLRGDYGTITIGSRTNIQDGAVIHCTADHPTHIGDGCVVGHLAHLEGCTIESDSLVGTGSIVLHDAVVRSGGFVAAGALVTQRTEVPAGALALGVPAKLRLDAADTDEIKRLAADYVANARRYRDTLRRLD